MFIFFPLVQAVVLFVAVCCRAAAKRPDGVSKFEAWVWRYFLGVMAFCTVPIWLGLIPGGLALMVESLLSVIDGSYRLREGLALHALGGALLIWGWTLLRAIFFAFRDLGAAVDRRKRLGGVQ